MKIRALAIVAALALPSLALADDPPKSPPMDKSNDKNPDTDKSKDKDMDKTPGKAGEKSGKLSDGDVKIIAHLHHVNQMEMEVAKLAQKTGTAAVKSYAETLERDHQTADKELTTFAKQHHVAMIPADKPQSDADRDDQKNMTSQMARLKTLKGAAFDKEFLNMMVAGHDKELAKIDVSTGAASDPDLQTMLKSIKPVLQRHSDQAHDLLKNAQAALDKPVDKLPSQERPVDKLPSQK